MILDVRNQRTRAKTVTRSANVCFGMGRLCLGWKSIVKLQKLRDPAKDFVVESKLMVTARVKLLVPSNTHAIAVEAVVAPSTKS